MHTDFPKTKFLHTAVKYTRLKKYSIIFLILAVCVSLGLFTLYLDGIIFAQKATYEELGSQLFWSALVILPVLCIPFICIAWFRDLKIQKGVIQYYEQACPKCGDDFARNKECCPRRLTSWSKDDVETYWQDFVLQPFIAGGIKRGEPPTSASWLVEHSRILAICFMFTAGITVFTAASLFTIYPAMLYSSSSIFTIPWYIFCAAVVLFAISRKTYSTSVECPKCSYPLPPNKKKGTCTECGTPVSAPSTFYPSGVKMPLFMNFALFAPIFFSLLWNTAYQSGLGAAATSSLSNRALIILAGEDGSDKVVWDEIAKRTFTAKENAQLAENVIRNRTAQGSFVHSRSNDWLTTQFNAQKLTPEMVVNLRRSYWVPEVILPENIIAGEPFSVILEGKSSPEINPVLVGTVICFEGVSVDDGPYQGQEERGLRVIEANASFNQGYSRFNTTITIDTPGMHTIRMKYWLMDRGYAWIKEPLPRNEDGLLTMPDDATWMIPVTIDTEVAVQN